MLFCPLLIIMFCLDAIIYKIVCAVCQTHPLFVSYHIEVVHNGKEFCKNFHFSASFKKRDALALIECYSYRIPVAHMTMQTLNPSLVSVKPRVFLHLTKPARQGKTTGSYWNSNPGSVQLNSSCVCGPALYNSTAWSPHVTCGAPPGTPLKWTVAKRLVMDRYWQGNGMEDMVPAAMNASHRRAMSAPFF